MTPDFDTLDRLRLQHPAWRLLRSPHAPLTIAFLNRVFIIPNIRTISQADLVEALEDELFNLREMKPGEFPKQAISYLNDWAGNESGWLRKFYPTGSDEPHFDLTPATEKAVSWITGLTERTFVGTESRLMTLFNLLRQMSEGTETDPEARIEELKKQRREIDAQIAGIEAGNIPLLDETGLKDRFQQFVSIARELLSDFREVEQNFRLLDRKVRERIALWEGSKGSLLEQIMGERDAIADSDQGKSFRAFWDFLMSGKRQDELSGLLDKILGLPAISELRPDTRLRRVHYDWLEAGEHTQRTVAQLSQQLRRFLDDQAWLENRRIMEILHGIESKALSVRKSPPSGVFMFVDDTSAEIELPMERPLFSPPFKPVISDIIPESGEIDLDAEVLFSQTVIDRAELSRNIRHALQERSKISMGELLGLYPLRQGLAELVTYIQIADDHHNAEVDEAVTETIEWMTEEGIIRRASMPGIFFIRKQK